jgi:Glycosyl hydrolase 36 superfamily, catalytic domain
MLKVGRLFISVVWATIVTAQVPAATVGRADDVNSFGQPIRSPLANWPLESFDRFSRIEIGRTAKPWLNVLGNGLFGGHLILLLSNRGDGREFRVDTSQSAITHTDLHLEGLGSLRNTIHGIGYSTFTFGGDPNRLVHVTYFLEPDNRDSEIWMVDATSGSGVTLRYGKRSERFERSSAFRIANDHIDMISLETAHEKLSASQERWHQYLGVALEHMGIRNEIQPILLREFVWDIYQVVAMVSTDQFSFAGSAPLTLRNANMGGTYTVLGLDVHGRDTLQMVPAISRFDPALAREILLNVARYTDETGRVCHRRLLSGQPIDRGHSDESYWLISALIDYLHITHDLSILEARVPYLENDLLSEYVLFNDPSWVRRFDTKNIAPARFTAEETRMLEHARRALTSVRFGPHGLPLMEDGDWNDALNRMQKGESVMNAGLYAYCLLQLSDLWQRLGQEKVDALLGAGNFERDLREFSQRYDAIKKVVNDQAWDGQWYVRGFDNQGNAFGSHANAEGRLYLNAQSWLILAGIPDEQRTEMMIRSVTQYLRKNDKLTLLWPAYTKPDDNIGNITHLPRGSNENGGQWRQCTLWWIAALRKLGKTDDALALFNQLLLVNADLNKMQTEPYLYNEYLRGPEASDPGSAGQQAHVQQAALVLATLAELYRQVKVTEVFKDQYDFPRVKPEAQLYSITGSGEKVPWIPKWVTNPMAYRLTASAASPAGTRKER